MVPSDSSHPSSTPERLPLRDLVASTDAALHGQPGSAMLRVSGDPPGVARRPLDDHPLEALLGFSAPPHWLALGVHCHGRARRIDLPSSGSRHADAQESIDSVPVVLTLLIDRTGHGAGVMRQGEIIRRLPGAPEGVVADACRRALGLPTTPAPPDTVELWLLIWLDRLVDTVAILGHAERYQTWQAVAGLHPAAPGKGGDAGRRATAPSATCRELVAASIALADATRQLADAWPWHRLRADPDVADTAGPALPPEITQWMDDGMYARWLLADLPAMADLASAVDALLAPALAATVAQTVTAAGLAWPSR